MAKKKKFFRKGKTFVSAGGLKLTKSFAELGNGLRIYNHIPKGSGVIKTRKKPEYHPPTRRKKVALSTLEGAGAGFVGGLATGGFVGMVAGVPIGAITGNLIGKKRTGQPIISKKKKKGIKSLLHLK